MTNAISSRPSATAAPTAPVTQMLAAVANPRTFPPSLRIAPPPMNPMPLKSPAIIRASDSGVEPEICFVFRTTSPRADSDDRKGP
jgi:hypothetical protein